MTRRTGTATFEGHRIAYETRGDGDRAVVFVHGWSANRRHWHRQMSGLTTDRRLVALDLPGHGESDKPQVTYTMTWLAGSVLAVLDAAGVRRAVLVGHSNGVPIVRQAERLRPEAVEALVAVDGPFRQSIPPPVVAWMRAALQRPDAESFFRSLTERTPLGSLPEADATMVKAGSASTPLHVHAGGLEGVLDPASWSADPISVPLLVLLAGGGDASFRTDAEQQFVRTLAPHAQFVVWADASHFLMMEHAERFNRLVEGFLDKLT